MGKMKLLAAAAAMLAVTSVARAAVIDEADWTLRDPSKLPVNWVLNGSAGLGILPGAEPQVFLSVIKNRTSQTGNVWHKVKGKVDSFTFIADIRVRHNPVGYDACPADGFALVFANANDNVTGGGGGAIGLFGAEEALPQFTAMEVNTWRGQGLGEDSCTQDPPKHETLAFDVVNADTGYGRDGQNTPGDPAAGGSKLGQIGFPTGVKITNGGWYRYQWNLDAATNTLTAWITGLEDKNKAIQKAKVLEIKPGPKVANFDGRFGISGATGGAVMDVDVAYTRIESPAIAP